MTGRSRRVLRITDAKGERLALRSRPASANLAETAAFMDGTKRILVFSMAGGTGRSYHADLCSHSFNPLSALPRNRFAALVLRVAER